MLKMEHLEDDKKFQIVFFYYLCVFQAKYIRYFNISSSNSIKVIINIYNYSAMIICTPVSSKWFAKRFNLIIVLISQIADFLRAEY